MFAPWITGQRNKPSLTPSCMQCNAILCRQCNAVCRKKGVWARRREGGKAAAGRRSIDQIGPRHCILSAVTAVPGLDPWLTLEIWVGRLGALWQ